jgi:FKBP-type peptidyl-prolyl cis-trans isomerase
VTAFDSRVANYIWAFQLGLQQMKKGGKATLYVPSRLAFGSAAFTIGNVDVPANSNLIFELELVDVFEP